MKRWPIIVAVVMLLSTWGSLQMLSHGEPVLTKKPFLEFPLTIGGRWQGKELGLQQDVLDVLKLSDYMMRVYVPQSPKDSARAEHSAPVWLYVGYYQSQRGGATYHSPKNCLPGAGWQFVQSERVALPLANRADIVINKVLIQKGLDKQIILYWYQDRGRVIASEYWAKAFLIWDAITKNRTHGALVRVSSPVTTTPEDAFQNGVAFVQDLWPLLHEYLPSETGGTPRSG